MLFRSDFMATALQQFPAMYATTPGGAARGLVEFIRSFQPGGTAFGYGPNGEQLPLTGMEQRFYQGAAGEANRQIIDMGKVSLAKAGTELLASTLATNQLQLTNPALISTFGANISALLSKGKEGADMAANILSTMGKFQDYSAVAQTETDKIAVQNALETYLQETLPQLTAQFGIDFTGLETKTTEVLANSVSQQVNAVYQGIIDAFKPGFSLTTDSISNLNSQNTIMTSGYTTMTTPQEPQDTRIPKFSTLGDTASNLSKTLDAHNRINSMAGNRFITSSYRNFALGSSNSDHVNGRAYDLIGDNLISYRDAVRRDGGFAEFHGKDGGRHLHVVPRIGDSISPAYGAVVGVNSVTNAATSSPNVYNITVNGAGSNAEEVANLVMHKIKVTEKINRERSY